MCIKKHVEIDYSEYIDRFPEAKVMVVGDIIVDKYIWGEVSRISPEAPVPVVKVEKETRMLGGAANVLNNMVSLGVKPYLCGVVGDDLNGRYLIDKIKKSGLITSGIIVDNNRPTTVKTRVVAHNQQVVRFDRETVDDIDRDSSDRMLEFAKKLFPDLDAIIISDYGKGVISSCFMNEMRKLIKDSRIITAVDPKTGNFEHYRGVSIITPNHYEAGTYCGFDITDEQTLIRAGRNMLRKLECSSVLITQGKDGMSLFERDGKYTHIPTVAQKVFDVTGAGDTVISTFCLGLVSGLDFKLAAVLSNFAAGIVVGEVGTTCVSAESLKKIDSLKYV